MCFRASLFGLALLGCLVAASTLAGPLDDAQRIVQLVESRYHSARTLKAVFLERYSEDRLAVRVESGTVYFSRPGRMRWEYEEPEQKLFLTDGKTAWFYVPADHTVTRAPMKESNDLRTPLAFITGKATLSRFCKRIDLLPQPGEGGAAMLLCHPAVSASSSKTMANEPQDPGEIRDVLLDVDPKDGWLSRVLIHQVDGIELEYRFGRWQKDMDFPEGFFHFQAPKGVAIVDEGATPSPRQ